MRKFNILLVDDEELAIRGIEQGVCWEKINVDRVYKAHSKDTAVRMIETYDIDIIISDIEMPNGNGLELIRWVRSNRRKSMNIFYTGHAEFSYAQEAIRLGVEDYLLKPIPYEELERTILRAEEKISGGESREAIEEIWSEVAREEDDVSSVEAVKKFIQENLAEDLQRDTLAAVVHMNPAYLSRMFKKQEGVSLSEYIMQKRITVAKQLLHRTNLPVSTIADRVGISFATYFNKLFKERESMSPLQYREMMKNTEKDSHNI